MTARRLLSLALLLSLGCHNDDEERHGTCADFCNALEACGLLPSALGGTHDACVHRCVRSRDQYDEIAGDPRCRPNDLPGEWCGDRTDSCFQVDACLSSVFGPEPPRGSWDLTVDWALLTDSFPSPCTQGWCDALGRRCEDGAKPAPPPPEPTEVEDPAPTCTSAGLFEAVGASSLRIRVVQIDAVSEWRETPLDSSPGELWRDLPAGPAQVELQVRGVFPAVLDPPSEDGEEDTDVCDGEPITPPSGSYCWHFRSHRIELPEHDPLPLYLPATAHEAFQLAIAQRDRDAKVLSARPVRHLDTCEDSPAACRDGLDNDGDARPDCADPDCAVFCGPEEADAELCADGEDNDDDGSVDCSDPGCADFCEQSQAECRDGEDNDDDGLRGCADPDCAEFCHDPDCADTSCSVGGCNTSEITNAKLCAWAMGREDLASCDDDIDGDGDGLHDDIDPDCVDDSAQSGE